MCALASRAEDPTGLNSRQGKGAYARLDEAEEVRADAHRDAPEWVL